MSSLLEIPRLLLMLDIESLDLGANAVVTQIAMLGYDLEQDEMLKDEFVEYLPAQPQIDSLKRSVSFATILWWMQQSDEARARFENNRGDDMFDVQYIMKSLVTFFNRITSNGTIPYVVAAKGPQFDVVAIESLLTQLDLEVPWTYNRVEDLRTMLRQSKIDPRSVPKPEGFIEHVGYWDARWQIDQYLACRIGRPMPVETPTGATGTGLPDTDAQKKLPIKS